MMNCIQRNWLRILSVGADWALQNIHSFRAKTDQNRRLISQTLYKHSKQISLQKVRVTHHSSERRDKLTRAERAELPDWPGDSLPSLTVPPGRYPHPIVRIGLQFLYGEVALLATVEVGHDSRLFLPTQTEGVEPDAVPQNGRLPHVSVRLTPRQPRDHHLPHPWSLFGNVWGIR